MPADSEDALPDPASIDKSKLYLLWGKTLKTLVKRKKLRGADGQIALKDDPKTGECIISFAEVHEFPGCENGYPMTWEIPARRKPVFVA